MFLRQEKVLERKVSPTSGAQIPYWGAGVLVSTRVGKASSRSVDISELGREILPHLVRYRLYEDHLLMIASISYCASHTRTPAPQKWIIEIRIPIHLCHPSVTDILPGMESIITLRPVTGSFTKYLSASTTPLFPAPSHSHTPCISHRSRPPVGPSSLQALRP